MILTTALVSMVLGGQKASALSSHISALQKAQGLTVNYRLQPVGAAATQYSISFAKPGSARIESPSQTIVADGKTIITFDKAEKTYLKQPQNSANLNKAFGDQGLQVWLPFFSADAFNSVAGAKEGAERTWKGEKFRSVQVTFDAKGLSTATYYLSKADGIARQVEFNFKSGSTTTTTILTAESLSTSSPEAGLFAFVPPTDAKEISEADLATGKWLHDIMEAQKASKATGRLIMIDFTAEWCGPCKMMRAEVFGTPEFLDRAKKLVLADIDVDKQPAVAKQFGIEAMPTVKFVDQNMKIVHEFVGYGGKAQVLGEIDKALAKFRG